MYPKLKLKPLGFWSLPTAMLSSKKPESPRSYREDIGASLNIHLHNCVVVNIVYIDLFGVISSDRLEDPDNEPWFFCLGEYWGIPRYFIVNDTGYLPLVNMAKFARKLRKSAQVQDWPPIELMNPDAYKEDIIVNDVDFIYDWATFSSIDETLIRAAIERYLEQLNAEKRT